MSRTLLLVAALLLLPGTRAPAQDSLPTSAFGPLRTYLGQLEHGRHDGIGI